MTLFALFKNGYKNTVVLYFLGLFMVGLGYIAILPPFEGFDESAHFSRVREISASYQTALNSQSFLDRAIVDFVGPMPYSSGDPPYDLGNTYSKFWNNSGQIDSFINQYRNQPFKVPFTSSADVNWQIQHPPLYYLLMASALNLASDLSFVDQLNFLRVVSFIIALLGLFFGYLAYQNILKGREVKQSSLTGWVVYPIVFPMFFLEFSRVGNDALCLFIVGLLSYFLSLWINSRDQKSYLVLTGFLLGFGLLTKAFFIPIAIGVGLFIVLQYMNQNALVLIKNELFVLIPLIAIGGSWYFYKFISHGDLGLGGEIATVISGSNVWTSFVMHFQLTKFLKGLFVPIVTFSWAATWSLVRMPILMQLPMIFCATWIVYFFLSTLKNKPLSDYEWLAASMFILMYLGLLTHVLVGIALTGLGTSGGWYLHILAPWLAPSIGIGLAIIIQGSLKRRVFYSLLIYAFFFQFAAIWSHMALFSGCAIKSNEKGFLFQGDHFCLGEISVIWDRLNILADPSVGLISFFLGFSLLLIVITRVLKDEVHQA